MTENEIKEMLKDIIDNDAEYEYRRYGYNVVSVNGVSTKISTPSKWIKYKLGDEIHSDWEYRKVKKWYVFLHKDCSYSTLDIPYKVGDNDIVEITFEGTKEECQKWINEHNNKTWLEKYIYEVKSRSLYGGEDYEKGIKDVCKKILAEVNNKIMINKQIIREIPYDVINKEDIENIIKNLGIDCF